MDNKALFNLSYGLFVLSTKLGGKDNACIVNTVAQVADNPIKIAVSVNKANLTCEMIERSGVFAAAVIDKTAPFELFKHFGFSSGRDTDKFFGINAKRLANGVLYPTEHINSVLSCRVEAIKDLGSHKLFIAVLEDAQSVSAEASATYAFYHSSIKPKPADSPKGGWRCRICGYIHEGDELPEDFICPICKHPASDFERIVISSAENKADNIKNNSEIKGENKMKKYVCSVCGYVHEGDLPEGFVCPTCKAPVSKFNEQKEGAKWVDEHVVGVAQGVDPEIIEGLRMNFTGECTEVGMYLAMARVAHREGYPEIGLYWEKAAWEEAEHASKFAELLGEVVTTSTKKNLEMRVDAESGACDGKVQLAKRAKELGLDAIHDTVHEMAKDEARHGRAFEGLLKRYFG